MTLTKKNYLSEFASDLRNFLIEKPELISPENTQVGSSGHAFRGNNNLKLMMAEKPTNQWKTLKEVLRSNIFVREGHKATHINYVVNEIKSDGRKLTSNDDKKKLLKVSIPVFNNSDLKLENATHKPHVDPKSLLSNDNEISNAENLIKKIKDDYFKKANITRPELEKAIGFFANLKAGFKYGHNFIKSKVVNPDEITSKDVSKDIISGKLTRDELKHAVNASDLIMKNINRIDYIQTKNAEKEAVKTEPLQRDSKKSIGKGMSM